MSTPEASGLENAPPTLPEHHPVVLYDGVCGFCEGIVKFLLRRDEAGWLRFASLQSELAHRWLAAHGRDASDLDTFYVLTPGEVGHQLLERARAGLWLMRRLGPGWRLLAAVLGPLPTPLLDLGYRLVAANRYRLFGKKDRCEIPVPEVRERFLG